MDNLWEIAKRRGARKMRRKFIGAQCGLCTLPFQVDSGDDGKAEEPGMKEEESSPLQKDQFVPFYGGSHSECPLVLPLKSSIDSLRYVVYTHKEPLYWHHVEHFLNQTLGSSSWT
jgi:hypothetical protein